jgi:hypothetical protein
MKTDLTRAVTSLLFLTSIALASFAPSVRIDHEDRANYICQRPAIAVGSGTASGRTLYVAFQDDSMEGLHKRRSDVLFQKSTDDGRTWLPADVLIRRGRVHAGAPDITTDRDGNVYIFYNEDSTARSHVYCIRSVDGGATWSERVQVDDHSSGSVGWGRAGVDSAGSLFVAWTLGHVYSSVSTDKGATWSPRVRVDDDTLPYECGHADVFVQPGTNDYLVTASAPFYRDPVVASGAYLYRSTDGGRTFVPGIRLDTFDHSGQPHVVADSHHIICDFTGHTQGVDLLTTEARTFYALSDSWGSSSLVSKVDTPYQSYYNGAKLAVSADGRVHSALMIIDPDAEDYNLAFYTFSSDHGATWSDLELVSDDTTGSQWNEDIGVDSAGHAYVIWQDWRNGHGRIWSATNNPLGVAEQPAQQPIAAHASATVVRNYLLLPEDASPTPEASSSLLDIGGRQVMRLKPGANDVRKLTPGVYFVRSEPSAAGYEPSSITKVVVAR